MNTWLSKIRLWEIALAVFLGFGCYFLWNSVQSEKQLTAQVVSVSEHMNSTLTKIDGVAGSLTATSNQLASSLSTVSTAVQTSSSQLNAVLAKIIAPCTPEKGHVYSVDEDKPCGTLADIARTLHTVRGFAGTLEVAGRHMNQSLSTYDQQEKDLSDKTNAVLDSTSQTIDYAKQLMEQHQQLLDNLQRLAGNSADTMENVKGITSDLRIETKKFTKPKSKTQRILQWVPAGAKVGMTVTCALLGPC